jgi:CheY-like chemotaxis protein
LQSGAVGFLAKPLHSKDEVDDAVSQLYRYAGRRTRQLLMVMPDSPLRKDFLEAIEHDNFVMVVDNADVAREKLSEVDCLMIDESVTGLTPEDLIDASDRRGGVCQLPVLLVTRPDSQSVQDDSEWHHGRGVFALHEAGDLDTLLSKAAFLLHRSPAVMTDAERTAVAKVDNAHASLRGRKALIVDDDMRNIFALATVLDNEGMIIVSAGDGWEAIRQVEADPDIDIVLMDIMMPELDGLATMQRIRKLPRGQELPMVAVTAKAMKGDRQKCIEAGAWDYLSKPVDPAHLLSVMRGWLCR